MKITDNPHFKKLNRIEFAITYACTGRCKHCSEGDHISGGEHIGGEIGADAVRKIAENYKIESLMTFGGEPLLYVDDVCKIHRAAKIAGIAKRQIITNGFFSKNTDRISEVVLKLAESGVNDILLSVDAFHQETIPLEPVMEFAKACFDEGLSVRLQPAWLVSREADNPYNNKTREILGLFSAFDMEENEGNVIFPSGNALKYLAEFFEEGTVPSNPYVSDPYDITSVCISPNGDTLGGNIYRDDILDILRRYKPE